MLPRRAIPAALLLAAAARAQEPTPDERAEKAVIDLASEEPEIRRQARDVLSTLRRAALPALRKGSASEDAEVAAVCRTLAQRIEDATIVTPDGPIPPGTPWCDAMQRLVTVSFRETPWSEVVHSFEQDLGIRLRIVGSGISQESGRTVTLRLEGAPLEFLVRTLLHRSLSENASGVPRIGWGKNSLFLTADNRPQAEKLTIVYAGDGPLRGVPPEDLQAIARFLERLGQAEDAPSVPALADGNLKYTASPWLHADASELIALAARSATGTPPPGAALDAAAQRDGQREITPRWSATPLATVLAELAEASGARFEVEPRIERWGLSTIYYQGNAQPAVEAMRGIVRGWSAIRVEQRWGAWWVFSDQMSEYLPRISVIPAREEIRQFQIADAAWTPADIEGWIGGEKPRRGEGSAAVVGWFPSSGVLAIRATSAQLSMIRETLNARASETQARRAALEGLDPPSAGLSAPEAAARIEAALAKRRVTKSQTSSEMQEGQLFQDVFHTLHESLGVTSTSGSFGGGVKTTLRACRLTDVPASVLWRWLNTGDFSWYLNVDQGRRTAAWGLGATRPRNGGSAALVTRARLHPDHVESFRAMLDQWNPRARKDWDNAPSLPASGTSSILTLPVPPAEEFFSLVGLGDEPGVRPAPAPGVDPPGLDRVITWPAGKLTAEESLFKLAELADLNFILELPREARTTRALELPAGEFQARTVLGSIAESVGATWRPDDAGVIHVDAHAAAAAVWVPLPALARLGVEEAAAVSAEFAKAGDVLWCFPATGKYLARCAPSRVAAAPAALEQARAAAEEASRDAVNAALASMANGEPAPQGYAGMLALSRLAGESPARGLELAQRLTAGGHSRAALKQYQALAAEAGTPDGVRREALAGAAFECARLGVADAARDAEAIRLGEEALSGGAAPVAARIQANRALAEAWRRCGNAARALACYEALEVDGAGTEESRRWIERLSALR